MIHIIFNAADVNLIKELIKLDAALEGRVLQIKDDFAVGPLLDLESEEGWNSRVSWWRELLKNSPYENDQETFFDDRETVRKIKDELDQGSQQEVWIWMGQNHHDVCGYYWFMQYFKEYQGRILVIYLNNLPFINEKGQLFYPSWIGDIQAKELLKAKRLARPISLSEFEVDPDEWKRLCAENSAVRILEGGKKLISRDETFYDGEIVKNLTSDWQKATRVLSNTLHRMRIKTGDVFLMWRMKELVARGKIEVLGDTQKTWKEFDVKLPVTQMKSTELENQIENS